MSNLELTVHCDFGFGGFAFSAIKKNCDESFEYLKDYKLSAEIPKGFIGPVSHMTKRHIRSHS